MEKIEYLESYELSSDAEKIDIADLKEGDFVHIYGTYSFDGEDYYGKSTGWKHENYNDVYKIQFDAKRIIEGNYTTENNNLIIFNSKKDMIVYIANNSRVNKMFEIKNIDYTFYKNESIKKIYTPREYLYYCDTKGCTGFFNNWREKLVKNDKRKSMKIMKDGTHKCFKCCNIGRHLPSIQFHLECNSQTILDKLLKILRSNSWNVHREDNKVIIGMILRDKVNYVVDMIAELNKKAKFDFRFDRKEKFYNPKKSEIIYYYKMRIK